RPLIFKEVAVRTPLLIDVRAAVRIRIRGAKEDDTLHLRPALMEAHLYRLARGRAARERCAGRLGGTEDSEYVVCTPGPERAPIELDPVAIGYDAQSGRADHTPAVIATNPPCPIQLVKCRYDDAER